MKSTSESYILKSKVYRCLFKTSTNSDMLKKVILSAVCLFLLQIVSCEHQVNKCGSTSIFPAGKLKTKDGAIANATCTWELQLNSTEASLNHVAFHFANLDLDDDDVVSIKDNNESTILFKGNQFDFVYISNLLNVTLYLKCSSVQKKRVLSVTYDSTECNFMLNKQSATLSSPVVADGVPDVKCTYSVGYTTDKVQYLSFSKFNIENSSLMVRDGSTEMPYNGSEIISDYIAKNNIVHLSMDLKYGNSSPEFEVSFISVTKACSNMIVMDTDALNLHSPGYPMNYPRYPIDCRWIITSENSNQLGVKFSDFQLANDEDRLEIKEGTFKNGYALADFGNKTYSPSQHIISRGNSLWIRFSTDSGPASKGFDATISTLYNGGYFKNSGVIELKQEEALPENDYTYLLEVSDKEQVMLSMVDNNTELYPNSKIRIYDGFDVSTANLIDVLKSESEFYDVVSTGNRMMVVATNFDGSNKFQAEFKGYPYGYHMVSYSNSGIDAIDSSKIGNITWVIKPNMIKNNKDQIELSISNVNLMENDTINVYNLNYNQDPVLTFNKTNLAVGTVKFPVKYGIRIEANRSYKFLEPINVFAASYRVMPACSKTYNLSKAGYIVIRSTNYPNFYPLMAKCTWKINTPPKKNLLIAFSKLNLHPGHVLSLKYPDQANNVDWSGNVNPNDLIVKGPETSLLTFESPVMNKTMASSSGFVAVLILLDEGEMLTKHSGVIQTAKYPAEVPGPLLSIWIVSVPWVGPNNTHNYITFSTSRKPGHSSFLSYYILDGPSLRGSPLKNVSDKEGKSRRSMITILYNKTSTKPQPGFKVTYSISSCPKSNQCGNGDCIQDSWVCDGVAQCDDMADEKNCNSGHTAKKVKNGVAGYVVAIIAIVCLIAGVLGAILLPKLYRKIKNKEAYSNLNSD